MIYLWLLGYLAGFLIVGRRGYLFAVSRERTWKDHNGRSQPRSDADDKGTALAIGVFWPFVVTYLCIRQCLRWTVWAPTGEQRFEECAASLADTIRAGHTYDLEVATLANWCSPAVLNRALELIEEERRLEAARAKLPSASMSPPLPAAEVEGIQRTLQASVNRIVLKSADRPSPMQEWSA